MQTGGTGFATAVASASQTIAYSVVVTLPATTTGGVAIPVTYGNLSDCLQSIDGFYRQITTSTPETTTLISGSPSSQPELVFSGPLNLGDGVMPDLTKTVYWLFNPFDPTSPLYRQAHTGLQIVIKMGLYDGANAPDLITVFTGTLDQVECDVSGAVTFTCLDRNNTITNQATLPPVITSAPFNAGLTNEYAIDYLFRHASPKQYYSWPQQRASCLLSVGLRSSLWPEVGSYASFVQLPEFSQGVFGTALTGVGNPNFIVYSLAGSVTPAQTCFFECWVNGPGFTANINDSANTYKMTIRWEADTGNLAWFTTSPTGLSSASFTSLGLSGKHYISIKFAWGSGSTTVPVAVTIDAGTITGSVTAKDARPVNFNLASVGGGVGTIEAVQITTETAPPSNNSFSPTLLLDPGGSLNPLTALPDVTGQTTASALQDIAASEAGVIGFNELGQGFFTNRETIQTVVSTKTVTSNDSLLSLATLEQQSLVATHVQIPVNQIQITAPESVWESSTVLAVGPGGYTFTATTTDPVVAIATTDSGFYPNSGAVAGDTYWQGSTTADGTGSPVTSGISVAVVQLSPTQLQITITNTTGIVVYLVTPTGFTNPSGGGVGSASLIIGGQAVAGTSTGGAINADAQWPPVGSGGAVSNVTYGEVLLQISANNWLQDLPTGQSLAVYYIEDLSSPKPMVQNISIIPDPRIQNLDRVTIQDPLISGLSTDALLIGINMSLANGTFSQAIDARMWSRPGSWLLGVLGSSELSLTTWIY